MAATSALYPPCWIDPKQLGYFSFLMKLYAIAVDPQVATFIAETIQVGCLLSTIHKLKKSVRILQWIMEHNAIGNNARLLPSIASRTSNAMFDE